MQGLGDYKLLLPYSICVAKGAADFYLLRTSNFSQTPVQEFRIYAPLDLPTPQNGKNPSESDSSWTFSKVMLPPTPNFFYSFQQIISRQHLLHLIFPLTIEKKKKQTKKVSQRSSSGPLPEKPQVICPDSQYKWQTRLFKYSGLQLSLFCSQFPSFTPTSNK